MAKRSTNRRQSRLERTRAARSATWSANEVLATAAGNSYSSADPQRQLLREMRSRRGTPDQHLVPALKTLQAQCAKLDNATPYGRGAVEGFSAELVGSGIDIMPTGLSSAQLAPVRKIWLRWIKSAGTRGQHLFTLQRQAARCLQRGGACLWRWIPMPERADIGLPPWALLPLPIEWLASEPQAKIADAHRFVAGVEFDRLARPVAYHLSDPEKMTSTGERVLAAEIIHIYEERLPGQSAGEPGLAPAVERVWQDGEMVVQELRAATVANAPSVVTTGDLTGSAYGSDEASGIDSLPVGSVVHLMQGESFNQIKSERPNTKIPEFRGTTRGDVAAIARVSQRYLDRDGSKTSYSSSRDDQQRTRTLMAPLALEFGRKAAGEPWLRIAPDCILLAGQRLPRDPTARALALDYSLRPDVPGAANPLEDAKKRLVSMASGQTSYQRDLAEHGLDMDEVIAERQKADEALAAAGLPPIRFESLLPTILQMESATDDQK